LPGLLGIVNGIKTPDVGPAFAPMRRSMERGGRLVSETAIGSDRRWALGRVHLGVLQPQAQLSSADKVHVLFHGDLFKRTDVITLLEQLGERPASETPPALIRALYRRFGSALGSRIDGSFCAAIFDEEARRLLLFTDKLGSYPLYWFNTPSGFAFASELRALVRIHPQPALNPRAVNDILHLSFPVGDKTLAADTHLLPPASTLTYDADTGKVAIERYASWAKSFRPGGIEKAEYFDALGRAFDVSIDRSVEGSHRYGLSLSGGMDTRVLLSGLDRQHLKLSTFTLGGKGCADEVIGYQLARMANSDHRFIALEESYLADLLPRIERMVSLTDGMYTSDGFTEMLALRAFEESHFSVLLRGHAGELAKASTAYPVHTDAQIYAMKSAGELVPYLLDRLETINHGSSATGLFSDGWREAHEKEGVRRSLEQCIDGLDLSPPDLCTYLYLTEYHRRVTVPSLEIFRNVVEVRLPLADPDFVECVFQGPASWRSGTEIHQSLVRRNKPEYLRIRNPNTGAPAGAGPMQEFVLDKLNSVLRRLNVYGYRHYHSFDGWMRKAFLDLVQQVLLTPVAMDRGVVREGPLRRIVDEARGGARTHDHVLQVLILVELWQRENIAAGN
jgi:asparagine synthase (glutamine-hydrolysing)